MILVADSGSTKCDWMVFDENLKKIKKTRTEGINPVLISKNKIAHIISTNNDLKELKNSIHNIYFYGSGCASEESKNRVHHILKTYFVEAKEITVEEDLTAAVRGVTSNPGVICILGTGSNCCFFDGNKIHLNQVSLGYSVMDEGSGNYFGKQLLKAYFYKKMPEKLREKFSESFNLSLNNVLEGLYERDNPSAFLASFASFLIQNKNHSFIRKIINKGISDLFDNLIACYKTELQNNSLHFVGSIAFYLQAEIIEEAKSRNYKVRSFVKRPIDNIVKNYKISK